MTELADRLADPLVVTVMAVAACAALLWRKARAVAAVLLLGAAALWALSTEPGAALLLSPLEGRFPALLELPGQQVAAVVVLAGGEGWAPDRPITSCLSSSTSDRLLEAIRVWRLVGENCPLLFVGGVAGPGRPAEAPLAAQAAAALGVPWDRLRWEAASRNTYENGLAVRQLLADQPFILVTSAFHMPRAMATFRALGTHPVPAPCGHQAAAAWSLGDLLPAGRALAKSAWALREYLALAAYRLRGWL
ncbi:MAG: YdcF family protein [Candidatus Bipolaricaulaceae bacterium]